MNKSGELIIANFVRIDSRARAQKRRDGGRTLQHEIERYANNMSVKPLDVGGRTRATLKESACVRPFQEGLGKTLNLLRASP